MRRIFTLLISVLISFTGFSQTDSCHLRISLLTCSPGDELYSTFGHSAMRVQDIYTGADLIYNYGTFEFGPDFYTKFIQGKLLYFLSIQDYSDFVASYAWEKRGIQEQVLQLSCAESQQLAEALQVNSLEANRYYRYDFLFDNCTTRLRDIVAKNSGQPVIYDTVIPQKAPTFRNLIHSYLNAGEQYWSKLGIDILLGRDLDKPVTNQQAMFLPDYLMKGFDSATSSGRLLAAPRQILLPRPVLAKQNSPFTPMVVFSSLLAIIIVLSFIPKEGVQKLLSVFDFLFFFSLGLTGLLLLFMWFGTNHTVCQDNYNLMWALPTHTIAAFFLWKKAKWVQYYLLATIIVQSLLLLGWIFLPQQLNISLIPIVLLILLRSWLLIQKPFDKTQIA
ncbi:DUF4105 domain-containing protein [Flavisolibacter tropicus]|uniref:Uncharacterized protein n=1 Tax=Flavisolibacter tropicus TaxID=1492898 RepID=A0A172TUE8_9BACT|nr:DUF4105 domain-containing protein [Flavisolibacter tropicus]ANE50504.1 hypothetical protein SY85_08335 [Flavisolibacter tropicus]